MKANVQSNEKQGRLDDKAHLKAIAFTGENCRLMGRLKNITAEKLIEYLFI